MRLFSVAIKGTFYLEEWAEICSLFYYTRKEVDFMNKAVDVLAEGIINACKEMNEQLKLHDIREATVVSSNTVKIDGVDYVVKCKRALTIGEVVLVMFYNGNKNKGYVINA